MKNLGRALSRRLLSTFAPRADGGGGEARRTGGGPRARSSSRKALRETTSSCRGGGNSDPTMANSPAHSGESDGGDDDASSFDAAPVAEEDEELPLPLPPFGTDHRGDDPSGDDWGAPHESRGRCAGEDPPSAPRGPSAKENAFPFEALLPLFEGPDAPADMAMKARRGRRTRREPAHASADDGGRDGEGRGGEERAARADPLSRSDVEIKDDPSAKGGGGGGGGSLFEDDGRRERRERIRIMKMAAEDLQRRAAHLERRRRKERKEIRCELRQQLQQREHRRKQQRRQRIEDVERGGRRWRQRQPQQQQQKGGRKKWKRHSFSLGQRARPCHMDAPTSPEDALSKIARLRLGDGAWVRRTGGEAADGDGDGHVWTYAILKRRSEDGLAFIVNERGCSKECLARHWLKFVRVVAPGYAPEDEGEDRMGALGELVLVPDHEVSMYTLGPEADAPQVVVLQDHEMSTYTLVDEEGDGPPPSSTSGRPLGSIAEHDHDISMYTFCAGVRAAAGETNEGRNITQKEVHAPDPPDGATRRHPADPPTADPSGRWPRAADRPDVADPPGAVSPSDLRSAERALRRSSASVPPASLMPITESTEDDAGTRAESLVTLPPTAADGSEGGGGKARKNHATNRGKDVPTSAGGPKRRMARNRRRPKEPSGKVQRSSKSLRPTKRAPLSESCQEKDLPVVHASISKLSKSLPPRFPPASAEPIFESVAPIFEPPEEGTGQDPGKGQHGELRTSMAPDCSIEVGGKAKKNNTVEGHDVPTHAGGLVDTKENRKKPSPPEIRAQQSSKSLPSIKGAPTSETCKEKIGTMGLVNRSSEIPTKEKSNAAISHLSKSLPPEGKTHAEHETPQHDDDAAKEKDDQSDSSRTSRNNEVGTILKDRFVSMYTLDGGDAALLSSADSTILLLESVSNHGRDVLAYAPCGNVVLTRKDGTRMFPDADGGGKVKTKRALRKLAKFQNVSGRALDHGDSLRLSSAGATVLLVESASERGRDILAYAPCGAVVTAKKNRKETARIATDLADAGGGQVEMSPAIERLSGSLDLLMPSTFDSEEEASTQQDSMGKKPAKERRPSAFLPPVSPTSISDFSEEESGAPMNKSEVSSRALPKPSYSLNNASKLEDDDKIVKQQQPLHDDEEEANMLNDGSDRTNRSDRIADFRQMCNSIQSESCAKQRRKPKPRSYSRRVSWSGELEERFFEYVRPSTVAPHSANGGDRVKKRTQRSNSLPSSSSLPLPILTAGRAASSDGEHEQRGIGALSESAFTVEHIISALHAGNESRTRPKNKPPLMPIHRRVSWAGELDQGEKLPTQH